MLEAALRYAQQGHHIFPITPGAKFPPLTPHGFKDATTDLVQIRAWWTEHPDANIGFWPAGSNLVAIDLDPGHEPIDLPITATVRTPRGKHLYYFKQGELTNRKLGPHIDVRAANGYTLLPPSVVDGQAYHGDLSEWVEDLPKWVADKLMSTPERCKVDIEKVYDNPANVARARTMLQQLNPATDGYVVACKLVRELALPIEVAIELFSEWNNTLDYQWSDEGIIKRCHNAAKYGHDTGERAVEAPLSQSLPPIANENGSQSRFTMRTPEEDANQPPLTYYDRQQTMPNVPDGAVMVVTGQKSSHKTGLVLKKCLDALEQGARVLYLAAEGGHGVMTIRLPLYQRVRELPWAALNERWRTLSTGMNIFADRAELIEAVKDFKPNIVVMDTLTKVIGGEDINAPATGSGIHAAADEMAAALGGALVILIHHPGKMGKDSMGSALIEALAYTVWHVSKEGEAVKCWVEKMKDGKAEFTVNYRIAASSGVPYVRDETPDEARVARKPKRAPVCAAAVRLLVEDTEAKDLFRMLQADMGDLAPSKATFYRMVAEEGELHALLIPSSDPLTFRGQSHDGLRL